MIKKTIFAASMSIGALLLATPAAAQSISQNAIEDRYNRALAAGYKALFLCSAIANADRIAGRRHHFQVQEWELAGIQSPLNAIILDMPHKVHRFDGDERVVSHVTVEWAEDMPARMAYHTENGGCTIAPIGTISPPKRAEPAYPNHIMMWHSRMIRDEDLRYTFYGAFDDTYGADARTTAAIISTGPNILAEYYVDDFNPQTPQRTWSVAKSIAATLIGAAVYRGEADVSDSAGLGESDDDPRRAITIDHGLRMATGRYSDTPGNRTDALYFGGATVDEVAVDWPLVHEPGTVYRYANNDTLIAQQAIEHTFEDHPPAALFDAIGMTGTVAETDWQGNYILSSQVWATAPDLARLGQLHLNDGVLPDGTRILPEGWVEYISSPAGPQPGGSRGWGYGAGWWLLNNHDGIPADTFMAAGNRGQFIVVVPSLDVVIVRRGEDPAGGSGFDIVAFTRDILATLPDD